jgi:hypothetical protein
VTRSPRAAKQVAVGQRLPLERAEHEETVHQALCVTDRNGLPGHHSGENDHHEQQNTSEQPAQNWSGTYGSRECS